MELNKFSSEHIQNELLTLTSETSSYKIFIESELQAKFDKYDQTFEQPGEELMDTIEQQHQY